MDGVWQDLKQAGRTLVRRPAFSALAVVTLALGIGVNTVAFSALNALLLRGFELPDAERLGWIMLPGTGNARGAVSMADLEVLETGSRAFETITAEGRLPLSLRTAEGSQQAWGLLVTADYLAILGARTVTGRLFTSADLDAVEVPAVVSYRFWQDHLSAAPSLTGRSIILNGRVFSVVGVLRDDFRGIGGLFAPDVWLPLERMEVLNLPAHYRTDRWLAAFGKLAPGATIAQARVELDAAAARITGSDRDGGPRSARYYPLEGGHPEIRTISRGAWVAFAAVAVILLIACFNVAALLLARAAERQKEISVRSALGASRGRIIRQLVTEGLVLATISGAAALTVSAWSAELLETFSLPAPIPQRLPLGIDRVLVTFTALTVLVAGVLPALLPALQVTRRDLVRSMRTEGFASGRSRTRNAFVIVQVAGSTLFVIAALLFARSFMKAAATDPGFDPSRTLVLEVSPSLHGYDAARSQALYDSLITRLTGLAGVTAVAIADRVPFYVGYPRVTQFSTDVPCGNGEECRSAHMYSVSRGFFDALGVRLVAGRDFTDAEMRGATAVIVSQRFASQAWPDGQAIGRTFRLEETSEALEVVGVASDYMHRSASEPKVGFVYRPLQPSEFAANPTIILRTQDDAGRLLSAVREQVRAADPDLPVAAVATMAERMKMPQWLPRTLAGFFVICGTLALVLASVGLFGVMYFTVAQRTAEFGIRVAIGATRRQVLRVVIGEAWRLAVPGIALGLLGGYIVSRVLAGALHDVAPSDPLSVGGTAVIQLVAALAASALPAWRATRADPIAALRRE